MGDSFTFGSFDTSVMPAIPDDAVYTSILERRMPGTAVINLGVDGYGVDQQALYLREEGFKYDPDLVVMAVFADNLHRSTLSFRDYFKPRYELSSNGLSLTGLPVPDPTTLGPVEARLPALYLLNLLRSSTNTFTKENFPIGSLEIDRLNHAILDDVLSLLRNRGTPLLLVVIPEWDYYRRVDRSERILEKWAAETGTPAVFLRATFAGLPPEKKVKLYTHHWTPLGHEVAAEAIHQVIVQRGLLPKGR